MDQINRRAKILSEDRVLFTHDENGNIVPCGVMSSTRQYCNNEMDYAKIYSDNWRVLAKKTFIDSDKKEKRLSDTTKVIFVSLANRMSYGNTAELRNAQIVSLEKETRLEIMEECDLNNEKVFYRHLKALVDCGIMRPAVDERGEKRKGKYQINPLYASKGQWHVKGNYNVFGVSHLLTYWDNPEMYAMEITKEGVRVWR